MGLDQYIYKATRISDDELDSIMFKNCMKIPDEFQIVGDDMTFDNITPDIMALTPYLREIQYYQTDYDMAKIKADNGVPASHIYGSICFRDGGIEWSFYEPGHFGGFDKCKQVFVSGDDLVQKYSLTSLHHGLVTKLEQVCYWRKNYTLQDAMHDTCKFELENCGFYEITEEMLEAIKYSCGSREMYERLVAERNSMDITQSNLFYHEWY